MNKLKLLFVSLVLLTLCSCSPSFYVYGDGWNASSTYDVPVLEPYTSIEQFNWLYAIREPNDSLSAAGHRALWEVLIDDREDLGVGDVVFMKDTSRYAMICHDIDSMVTKHPYSHHAWKAKVPTSVLDYMKEQGLSYLWLIAQRGFEHNPACKFYIGLNGIDPERPINGSWFRTTVMLADAENGTFAAYCQRYYPGYRHNKENEWDRPSQKQGIRVQMYHLLGN